MRRILPLLIAVLWVISYSSCYAHPPLRPVATYSIVARDPATGEIGVAVQSHWFGVGTLVPWAEAGIGAVATQSFIEPAYGPLGLDLMRLGRTATQALNALVSTDPDRAVRQVAMVDAHGEAAAYTGSRAIFAAGHTLGPQFAVQANLMEKSTVWGAMARAFEAAKGDLAERLLEALEAAEKEGGDIRGRQAAALIVVAAKNTGRPWVDRRFDLRVEDNPHPVTELRRLTQLQRTYLKLGEGDEWMTKKDLFRALTAYSDATGIVPDAATNGEAAFWTGVTLADSGRVADALPYLVRAYKQNPHWAELITRLPAAGLLPADPILTSQLVTGMKH